MTVRLWKDARFICTSMRAVIIGESKEGDNRKLGPGRRVPATQGRDVLSRGQLVNQIMSSAGDESANLIRQSRKTIRMDAQIEGGEDWIRPTRADLSN